MEQNEKIKWSQFTILVTLFTIGTSVLLAPTLVAQEAKQDAWIVTIIGVILGYPLLFLYNKIASSFAGRDFFTYVTDLLGTWPGKIISLLLFIYCVFLSSLLIRQVAHFAVTQSFVETPKEAIISFFVLIVIVGGRYGIETLARTGEILFPWVFFLLFILLIALIPELKTERLFPMFEEGVKPLFLGTFVYMGIPYFELFLFLILIPYIKQTGKTEKTGKAFYIGMTLGGIVLIIITLYALLTLGAEATARNQFPSYVMAKTISIANIIERIESFLAAIWFVTIFMKSALTFYCSTLCLANVFNLKDKKFLMVPLGFVLVFLTEYITPNIAHFSEFVLNTWTLYTGTYAILLPLLLITVAAFKKRNERRVKHAREGKN
ncbi:MAG TPA: spore gernimation protein [Paenibacillaceae bacterium]|nr:spore gernimation protein [Paenibacillaceae bacterium]